MAVLLFASHRSILLLKPVWASMTACHLASPSCLANEGAAAPAGDQRISPQTQRTREHCMTSCHSAAAGHTDAPRALFVYVPPPPPPPHSLCLDLPQLCSTSANCLLAYVCVCLHSHTHLTHGPEGCTQRFKCTVLHVYPYWRRQQRLRRRLWGAQVPHSLFPLLLFSVIVSPHWLSPASLTAARRLKQLRSADSSSGEIKASSSWTIL